MAKRHVAGEDYDFIIAGDVDLNGQSIEAWKNGTNVAALFTAYESDKMTFWCADEIPLRLVEELIITAIERRHAENTYDFLLRKG